MLFWRILGLLQQALILLVDAFELNLGRLNVVSKELFQFCSFRASPLVLRWSLLRLVLQWTTWWTRIQNSVFAAEGNCWNLWPAYSSFQNASPGPFRDRNSWVIQRLERSFYTELLMLPLMPLCGSSPSISTLSGCPQTPSSYAQVPVNFCLSASQGRTTYMWQPRGPWVKCQVPHSLSLYLVTLSVFQQLFKNSHYFEFSTECMKVITGEFRAGTLPWDF